ncbi:hypothetical protein [Gordonia sp. (in: high G+C Gram-positive bacteria)]|uniref:hypothetical protein n=1 Tax=Gordonia sp. (in: high G+C Gram-positive bacteria) TaxID=84139 RepID=UPI00261DD3F4|nr:hypothetical protein [Gordonia sp. (in: high G+C Gram-positive bacteria)]
MRAGSTGSQAVCKLDPVVPKRSRKVQVAGGLCRSGEVSPRWGLDVVVLAQEMAPE